MTATHVGIALLIALVLFAATLALLSTLARRPSHLGIVNGRLAECPRTPNCVSSFATDPPHHIAPFAFTGAPDAAWAKLCTIVAAMPRAKIVSRNDRYLHAEFTSALFRFVDDAEFLLDPAAQVIHVRSASRVGRSDLGVNRRRMEALRKKCIV